jgi:hypothetical protein
MRGFVFASQIPRVCSGRWIIRRLVLYFVLSDYDVYIVLQNGVLRLRDEASDEGGNVDSE